MIISRTRENETKSSPTKCHLHFRRTLRTLKSIRRSLRRVILIICARRSIAPVTNFFAGALTGAVVTRKVGLGDGSAGTHASVGLKRKGSPR